jgi:hypothetical protein
MCSLIFLFFGIFTTGSKFCFVCFIFPSVLCFALDYVCRFGFWFFLSCFHPFMSGLCCILALLCSVVVCFGLSHFLNLFIWWTKTKNKNRTKRSKHVLGGSKLKRKNQK